jgi:peptide chain release factor subunit 1
MLGRGVLSRLHCLTEQDSFSLTLYLDIDQNKQSNRKGGHVVQAEAMLKEIKTRHAADGDASKAVTAAIELVRKLKIKGRTAVFVVHPASGMAEVHQIQVGLPVSVHWRRGAFLRPIVEAMDEHERYGVVLADTQRARLFTIQLGEIVEHEDLLSETAQKTRAHGTDQWRAQSRQARHHEEKATLHAKRSIDALYDLSLRAPFDRLIVAGPRKAAAQIVRLLSRKLQGKLVETIALPVNAPRSKVLESILKVQERMERDHEASLVDGLIAELHDGGKAVSEFSPVVDAVNQGRVWKLVYGKEFAFVGGECLECSCYLPTAESPCPHCGGEVATLPYCIDRLSQSVIDMGGQVEVVDGLAARKLAGVGSIGAVLRY